MLVYICKLILICLIEMCRAEEVLLKKLYIAFSFGVIIYQVFSCCHHLKILMTCINHIYVLGVHDNQCILGFFFFFLARLRAQFPCVSITLKKLQLCGKCRMLTFLYYALQLFYHSTPCTFPLSIEIMWIYNCYFSFWTL